MLFASLLLTIGVHPMLNAVVPGTRGLEAFLAVNLAAAIVSITREGSVLMPLVFGIAFVAVRVVEIVSGIGDVLPLSHALWASACVLATVSTVRHALRPGAVDRERIFAALDAYLMAGVVFGVCYWVLEQSWPDSFGAPSTADLSLGRAIYFSFVALATLGYGDGP